MLPPKVSAPVPFLVIETAPEIGALSVRLPVPERVSVDAVEAAMPPAMMPPSWLKVVAPPRVIGAFRVAPAETRRAPTPSALPAPTRLRPAKVAPGLATKTVLPESTETVVPVPVKPVVLSLLEEVPLTWMVPVKPARLPVR